MSVFDEFEVSFEGALKIPFLFLTNGEELYTTFEYFFILFCIDN